MPPIFSSASTITLGYFGPRPNSDGRLYDRSQAPQAATAADRLDRNRSDGRRWLPSQRAVFSWWLTPRIDATNLETFQATYKVIRDSLPEADRGKLDGASSIVTMTNAHIYVPRRPTPFNKDGKKRSTDDISFMVKALHGMTGAQIIAEGEKISRERPDQWRRRPE